MPPSADDIKIARIASLTILNAMVFQQILATTNPAVGPLGPVLKEKDAAEHLIKVWTHITTEIDYVPIFKVALEILSELQGTPGLHDALQTLGQTALRITGRRTALRHDLMGRIFHRLLADAKYFGAFYTTVPAAALLLKLTFASWKKIDWSSVEDVGKLRIADLACGTGTLLKAAVQTISDNHVREAAGKNKPVQLGAVHKALVEGSLYGLDVIPVAIHLAASALSMHEPDVQFRTMNLFTLLLGGKDTHLGSLEFLSGREKTVQANLFGGAIGSGRTTGHGDVIDKVELPSFDLCVMNPPFTRSVGGNLLFGHAPPVERKRMQKALQSLVQKRGVSASVTAGLGSVFIALGHQLLNAKGHLALVIPRALLSGISWTDTRLLLGKNYHVQYIVVSHEPGGWNFSENTKLSECMIVARWLGEPATELTTVVNLWTRPRSSIEALAVADRVLASAGPMLDAKGVSEITTGTFKWGEVLKAPGEQISRGVWHEEVAFAQTELSRAAYCLNRGLVYIPSSGIIGKIPLTKLKALGDVGPDRRDIHDGFDRTESKTAYPALWGHDTENMQELL